MDGNGNGDGGERRSARWEQEQEWGRGGNGNEDEGGDPWTNTGWEWGRERGRKREQYRKEDGIGEDGRAAKKSKKPHKSCKRHVGNGGDLDGKRKNVDKKGLVQ